MIVRSVLTMLVLMLWAITASAQQDIRISPELVSATIVSDSLRNQAAFVVGTKMLFAFGITRADEHGGLRGEIRLVDVGTIASSERVLTTPDARPSGAIAIRLLRGGMVVFWNDLRSGSHEVYARRVDDRLLPSGPEIRLFAGTFAAEKIWLLDRSASDVILLWNTPDHVGMEAKLDDSLRLLDSMKVLPIQIATVQSLEPLSGSYLLCVSSADPAWCLFGDGSIDARPVTSHLVGRSFIVNADTSVILAKDSSLVLYAPLFDTTTL